MIGVSPYQCTSSRCSAVGSNLFPLPVVKHESGESCARKDGPEGGRTMVLSTTGQKRKTVDDAKQNDGGPVDHATVNTILCHIFNEKIAAKLTTACFGLDPRVGGANDAILPPSPAVSCRLSVEGFAAKHFAMSSFPPFRIQLLPLNDNKPFKAERAPEIRVRVAVFNKWAEVSSEVLPDTELVFTLKRGQVEVRDLVFQEVSVKHGGFFVLHISPVDYLGEILPWKSPRFQIQSVKSHCIKRRKMRESSVGPAGMLSGAADAHL